MGNSASKKARLEQLERDCAQTTSDLAARDQELTRAQKGLEASQNKEQVLSNEAETLRKKCAELDTLSKALEEERTKHIAKLQGDLRLKTDEVIASRRVVESRTMERDDARRHMKQIEEKSQAAVKEMEEKSQAAVKEMEEKSQAAVKEMEEKVQLADQKSREAIVDSESRRKEIENATASQSKELEETRLASASLADNVKQLEQKYAELNLELETVKSQAVENLAAARATAEQELTSSRAQAREELALAKSSMTDSARNLTTLKSELATTKNALAAATTKLQTLTLTHNESVTRRTASYEAFTATKQELADAQKRFLELNDAHEKLRGENQSAVAALKAEREGKESLHAELAALRKKLVESESRKRFSDVQMKEVRLGAEMAAAA